MRPEHRRGARQRIQIGARHTIAKAPGHLSASNCVRRNTVRGDIRENRAASAREKVGYRVESSRLTTGEGLGYQTASPRRGCRR